MCDSLPKGPEGPLAGESTLSRQFALVSLLLVAILGFWFRSVGHGGLGRHETPGTVTSERRPDEAVGAERAAVASAERDLLAAATLNDGATSPPDVEAGASPAPHAKQILFGDLHVHTTFSFDAFMLSLPMTGGEGAHPPADACDFARFCSALDFWSINDHAESITPTHWAETVASIRACDAVSSDSAREPDTVAFLGWEWTQVGATPDKHYGHKNVVLRDLDEDSVPTRPIGAPGSRARIAAGNPFGTARSGAFLHALGQERMHGLARFFEERRNLELCPLGVSVRELPADCLELVDTPDLLFDKLDDWGFESIVIPHGTTWGFYTPPGSEWSKQLAGPLHDEDRQKLLEIYSGHGNSEEYRSYRSVDWDEKGRPVCPEPNENHLPTCWRAGEIIEERCLAAGESEAECAKRAVVARQNAAEAGSQMHLTAPGVKAADWLDAGQCRDCTQPAFNYRPGGAAQAILAFSNFETPDGFPRRFRFGLMASSDNHFGRPGTGYKEVHRSGFTESRSNVDDLNPMLRPMVSPPAEEPLPESRAYDPATSKLAGFALMEMERQASYFMTGGLVAVHGEGRSRSAIWDALQRREVYGTSGPRILLWFDLLNPPDGSGSAVPMGGEVVTKESPRFEVRAVGSFEQAPGCPDYATTALGPDRLAHVCKGECYNPTPTRRPITRIEVVRIRPQNAPGEPIAPLIEDPWRSFACEGQPEGCSVRFEDPDYATNARDAVYYVRAIEAPMLAVNAAGIACERDASGRCLTPKLCSGDATDDCLAPEEPRAWSSPIFVDWPR
ncbi:MAG: DUF3604 domain-containing protein [Deltaproteobacteria bacterium]|nr:DUF3604 domain-containing protein [Deltaproteobacteria bacterium]